MYAQSNQISTVAGSYGAGAVQSVAQDAPRESTALEAHLSFLIHLQEQAGSAANRAMRTADRLFGCEPAMIGKGTDGGLKAAQEPPMIVKVEEASRVVSQLLETLHQHISRLERI